MPENNAEFVADLNLSDPSNLDVVSQSAGQLRGIKKALKQTFPAYDEALNVGADYINLIEARISDLENNWEASSAMGVEFGSYNVADGATGIYTTTGVSFQPNQLILIAAPTTAGGSTGFAISYGAVSTKSGEDYIGVATSGPSTLTNPALFPPTDDFAVRVPNLNFTTDDFLLGSFVQFLADGFSIDHHTVQPGRGIQTVLWVAMR